MKLDLATVLDATGATVVRLTGQGEMVPGGLSVADLQQTFGAVSIDSRSLPPESLFVALPGERVDGHDFVGRALAAGARGCLVSRLPSETELRPALDAVSRSGAGSVYLFLVRDSLRALQRLAHGWRRRHGVRVVGITGSIGKTTTKEIMAAVLARRWSVLKSEGNLNTEVGLPLMLLRLGAEHDLAVLEMGMYAPGDIACLAEIARPQVGVVTNVAPIHLERMGTIERIARAKSELVAALPGDGRAILNGDDPWTRAMAITSGVAPVILVGRGPECHYRAAEVVSHGLQGISFTVQAEGRALALRSPVPGDHTVPAFLAAIAVARDHGMEWEEIREAVAAVRFEERQRILSFGEPAPGVIIDDSYNAAPVSVKAALALLQAAPGTKIAVLGDMLELGPLEEDAHREVGQRVAEVADWLVVRGPRSAWIADEAERRGLPGHRVLQARSNAEAVRVVRDIMLSGSDTPTMQGTASGHAAWTVLVKGSRSMKLEEVVQGLRGEA